MQEYPRNQSAEGPAPFLATVDNRLSDIKQVLYGISEKLNAGGFYPPPTPAPSGDNAPPAENTLRHSIDANLTRMYDTALSIKEQVDRLT